MTLTANTRLGLRDAGIGVVYSHHVTDSTSSESSGRYILEPPSN